MPPPDCRHCLAEYWKGVAFLEIRPTQNVLCIHGNRRPSPGDDDNMGRGGDWRLKLPLASWKSGPITIWDDFWRSVKELEVIPSGGGHRQHVSTPTLAVKAGLDKQE
jgi:hypothetical protein